LVDSISNYEVALIPDDRKSEASVQLALRIVTANLKGQIEACHAQVISQDPLPKVIMSLERLIQLLQCVLENALKFRGDHPPILRVSAERDEDDRWVICVEDNGLGIDPDDVAMVFRPFERLHGSEYPGAGLGLTICRTIVESHGGHIWIDPRPRAGTMICFSVPGADP
jgi:signal transduction histidine kinase